MKKQAFTRLAILLALLFLTTTLSTPASAKTPSDCSDAGYVILDACNTSIGDKIMPYSTYSGPLPVELSFDDRGNPLPSPPSQVSQTNQCCQLNQAPIITSTPSTLSFFGNNYHYQVIVDEDIYNSSYSLVSGPQGMTISPSGFLEWNNISEGNHSITLSVSDGYYSDSQTFNLEVIRTECTDNGYYCTEPENLQAGDIEKSYNCSLETVCYEPYQSFTVTLPDSFWSLEFSNIVLYDRNWSIYEGEYDYSDIVVWNETIEGDMGYRFFGLPVEMDDLQLRRFYTQDEYLTYGNHNVTVTVIDENLSEMDCEVHYEADYNDENNTLFYFTSNPAYDASYTHSTWLDDQASCALQFTDGITTLNKTVYFNKTALSKFEILDPQSGDYSNGGFYSDMYPRDATTLPTNHTVVHGNFSLGVNITGRMAHEVLWAYVWFNYYGYIPPEVPTAGFNTSGGTCTQEDIDNRNFDYCNYWHFILMNRSYLYNNLSENKIFVGTYDSTKPQWNKQDVMWRYYARVYDRDLHYTARTYTWDIIIDNIAPGAPENLTWQTYPSEYYPGRINIDFKHPGDNAYDPVSTYDNNLSVWNFCKDIYNRNTQARKEIDNCGWYEFKYRNFSDGPVTESNWDDPKTMLYQESLKWLPAGVGTYQHTWIDIYPQFVPDHWRYDWVDFPKEKTKYYVGLRAYDGEGQVGPIAVPDAKNLTVGADIYDLPQGAVLSGWGMQNDIQLMPVYYNPRTHENESIKCVRDRDADKYDNCVAYKDDGGPDYPPKPNWVTRTMYLYDNLTLSARVCNFGNLNQTVPVYLKSLTDNGNYIEQQTEVFLPWSNPEIPEIEANGLNCKNITFHQPINRESLYLRYEIFTSSMPGESNVIDNYALMDDNFHTWSTDSIVTFFWYNYFNESLGYTVNVYRDPVMWGFKAFDPIETGSDIKIHWELENAYDYRFPMWEYPVTYKIREVLSRKNVTVTLLNGTNVTRSVPNETIVANETYIYYRTDNGDGWNFNDKIMYFDQEDAQGYRNNYIEYVNISEPIFMDIRIRDWPLVPNEYKWNNDTNYWMHLDKWNELYPELNYTESNMTHELHWGSSYPWIQIRWFHVGTQPKELNLNVTYGLGSDAYVLPVKWSLDSSGIPDPEYGLPQQNRTFTDLNKTMDFTVFDGPHMYPTVNANTQCFVDINPDSYTGEFIYDLDGRGIDELLEETKAECFQTTEYCHTYSNSEYYYERTWNWTPQWVPCNTTGLAISNESILKITTDVVNPSVNGNVNGAGRTVIRATKLYSYVNEVSNFEDTQWEMFYIQPNNGTQLATFFFRPDRVGNTTFEAWLDWYNDKLDENVSLPFVLEILTPEEVAAGKVSHNVMLSADILSKKESELIKSVNEPIKKEYVNKEFVKKKGFFQKIKDFGKKLLGKDVEEEKSVEFTGLPEQKLPEGYKPKTADAEKMIQAKINMDNEDKAIKEQRLREQEELNKKMAEAKNNLFLIDENYPPVEDTIAESKYLLETSLSSEVLVGGMK